MSLFPVDEPALQTFLEGHAGNWRFATRPKNVIAAFSSISASRLTKATLLFPYNCVHHAEAVTSTRGISCADVQVDYLRVEVELPGLWTDPWLFGLAFNNCPNLLDIEQIILKAFFLGFSLILQQ